MIELREDGVYLVSMSMGNLNKEAFYMPMNVEVGDTWTTEIDVTSGRGRRRKVAVNGGGGRYFEVRGRSITRSQRWRQSTKTAISLFSGAHFG